VDGRCLMRGHVKRMVVPKALGLAGKEGLVP
jgi:hypothetical protein